MTSVTRYDTRDVSIHCVQINIDVIVSQLSITEILSNL